MRKTKKWGMRMELPKNIVQIGKPDKTHKIFVEDYVISYIKQVNRACNGKATGLALYGKYMEEEDCKYYFLYGAACVQGIEHRGPYLSEAEKEEIMDIGSRYFSPYRFLAWCSIHGEPAEGFYVLAQNKGVPVEGYACFYEKNESMLNYMLMTERHGYPKVSRESRTAVEQVPAEVKTVVETKQQEPAFHMTEKRKKAKFSKNTEYLKVAVAAVFLVLCVVGITTLNDYEKLEDLQVAARQVIAGLTEQKLPDAPVTVEATIPEERKTAEESETVETQPQETQPQETQPQETQPQETQPQETAEAAPVAYVVVKGDTLNSICRQRYGSLERLAEICELNGIARADLIKIGQTILLPR